MKLFLMILMPLSLTFYYSQGQQNVVGRVVDIETNKPVKNATVTVKETSVNTTTNALGFFQLAVDTTNNLIIASDGYETGQIKVPVLSSFTIQLKRAALSQIIQVNNDYEKGAMQSGYKIGIWEYFDKPGELSVKTDYNSGQLLYVKKDTLSMYPVKVNGNWTTSTLTIQPRYIGSMHEFYTFISSRLRYPAEARRNSTAGSFYVSFEIDTTGRAVNFKAINDIGDNCAEEVIRVLNLIPDKWTVATKDNSHYESQFILPVTFKIILNGQEVRQFKRKKSGEENLPIGWKLDELIITAAGVTR